MTEIQFPPAPEGALTAASKLTNAQARELVHIYRVQTRDHMPVAAVSIGGTSSATARKLAGYGLIEFTDAEAFGFTTSTTRSVRLTQAGVRLVEDNGLNDKDLSNHKRQKSIAQLAEQYRSTPKDYPQDLYSAYFAHLYGAIGYDTRFDSKLYDDGLLTRRTRRIGDEIDQHGRAEYVKEQFVTERGLELCRILFPGVDEIPKLAAEYELTGLHYEVLREGYSPLAKRNYSRAYIKGSDLDEAQRGALDALIGWGMLEAHNNTWRCTAKGEAFTKWMQMQHIADILKHLRQVDKAIRGERPFGNRDEDDPNNLTGVSEELEARRQHLLDGIAETRAFWLTERFA